MNGRLALPSMRWTYRQKSEKVILAGAFGVTLVEGFDYLSLSFAAPQLMHNLGLTPGVMGLVFAVAVAGTVTGSLLLGLFVERVRKMTALGFGLVVFGLCSFLMMSVDDVRALMLNRFVAGLGLGGVGPVAVALAAENIHEDRRRALIGIVWSGIPAGAVLAGLFSYLFVADFGWNSLFAAGAILPLLSLALAFAVFGTRANPTNAAGRLPGTLRVLWRSDHRLVLSLLCILFILGFSSIALLLNWIPIVLRGSGFSNAVASLTASGVAFWGVLSSVCLGMLSARYRIHSVLVVSFLLALIGYCLMAILPGAYTTVALIVFAGGLSVGVQSSLVALTTTLFPVEAHSAALGLAVAAGRLSQIPAVAAVGLLIARWGGWTLFIVIAICSVMSVAAVIALQRLEANSPNV